MNTHLPCTIAHPSKTPTNANISEIVNGLVNGLAQSKKSIAEIKLMVVSYARLLRGLKHC